MTPTSVVDRATSTPNSGGRRYAVVGALFILAMITYVDRVKAPILFLIGENDSRCPPDQAMAYVNALRARGGEAELYTYGAGHSSYVVDEGVRQWRAVLEFVLRRVPV